MALRYVALCAITLLSACSTIFGIETLEAEPPLLAALSTDVGTLSPAFSPEVTQYRVELPLGAQTVAVSAMGGVGVSELRLEGASFLNDVASVEVALGSQEVSIDVLRRDGVSSTVSIELIRGALWMEHSIVKDEDAIENARFGSQIDSDGLSFVTANSTSAGVEGVAVYQLVADIWTQQPISPPTTCPGVPDFGEYGASVAIQGDQLLVGAPSCSSTGEQGGFVQSYAFREKLPFWIANGAIRDAIFPDELNRYGTALALADDALGVTLIEAGGTSKVIELLEFTGGSWTPVSGFNGTFGTPGGPVLLASNGELFIAARGRDYSILGRGVGTVHEGIVSAPITSVSFDGDTFAVGAEAENSNAGVVFVVRRAANSTVYELEATLRLETTDPGDLFGAAVSLRGDVLIVGAPGESSASTGLNGDQLNNGAAASGAAYVFVRNGSSWSQVAFVKASNVGAADNFGTAVEILDDRFLVGAPGEDSTIDPTSDDLSSAGAVYFFQSVDISL